MVFGDGTREDAMTLQEEWDTKFPILIDDGTVFSRFDPDRVTPRSVWLDRGMQIESLDMLWNNDVIEDFVTQE